MTLYPEHLQRWVVTQPGVSDDPDQFPLLPGQMLLSGKAPVWSTSIATSISGRERRRGNWSYPRWRFKTKYEVIRDRPSLPELDRLYAFFCLHQGQRYPFSFFDPYDNLVADQVVGVGNGTQTLFQLTRSVGTPGLSFTEPVRRVLNPVIRVAGAVQSTYTIDSFGRLQLPAAPATGAQVTWSGSFMFLCRFTQDDLDPEQMTRDLWSLEGLEFMSVKR